MEPPADFKVPKSRSSDEPSPKDHSPDTPDSTPNQPLPTSSYVEPSWACKPDEEFSFEVLKNGQIIETFSKLETKSHWSFGRLPSCNDIVLAHPTISRFHAVLQYRGEVDQEAVEEKNKKPGSGWYLYDLGSTHGTYVNKQRVPVKTYVRLRVGYMLKMGASTRSFILLGPNHDEEEVKATSIAEMREQKQKAIEEVLLKQDQQRAEEEERARAKEAEGVSWGMAEDAEDETDLSVNPFAVSTNEELFLDDPKKTLRGFFEREGLELEYKTEDLPNQTFLCKVLLPVEDENGRSITAQVTHKGKKKDCVAQCALEACRILDRHGVLRKANQEAAIRRTKKADSDSDNDDDFLDRTGHIEKRRKRKAQVQESGSALTFDELVQQQEELKEKILRLKEKIAVGKLANAKKKTTASREMEDADDDLDAFMNQLERTTTEKTVDKVAIRKYRMEEQALQKELKQVQRLIEITRPLELPRVQGTITGSVDEVGVVNREESDLLLSPEVVGKKSKLDEKITIGGSVSEESKKDEEMDAMDVTMEVEDMDMTDEVGEKVRKEVLEKETLKERSKETSPVVVKPEKSTKPESVNETISKNEKAGIPALVSKTVNTSEEQHRAQEEEAREKKKARQRVRIRKQVRDNVDMEETVEETEEKFTDWLPPSNQSGDGTTSLNDKLGY